MIEELTHIEVHCIPAAALAAPAGTVAAPYLRASAVLVGCNPVPVLEGGTVPEEVERCSCFGLDCNSGCCRRVWHHLNN